MSTLVSIAGRRSNSLQSYSLVSDLNEKVDCKVTHWQHVPCNATICGTAGFKWKRRSIIVS